MSAEARRELALGLAREISERHGVAVDVAIHAPGREGDQRNHHAHLLTTTRRIGPEGLGEKTRELDQKTSGEVERWRGRWAEMQNVALERAGSVERVDHRSHQRQGIEQEATVHMGPSATAMERRAEHQAMREGRAYEPVTMVGQHNAGVIERRGLRQYMAQSARSCDFGHLGEHVGNGLVVVDDRPCEERRSAPIRERRYEPWRFEWGSDRLLEPEFFGHRVRDRQSGDGTTGIGGSA